MLYLVKNGYAVPREGMCTVTHRDAVYVCGAPASGKTHLVEILRDRAAAHCISNVGLSIIEADDVLATEFAARLTQRKSQLEFANMVARRALVSYRSLMVGQIPPNEMRLACQG